MAVAVTFWKLNPKIRPAEVAKIAAKVMEKGLYPPENLEIIAWYICPGGEGVTITESETIDPVEEFKNWMIWIEEEEFFEYYKTYSAINAAEAIEMALKMAE